MRGFDDDEEVFDDFDDDVEVDGEAGGDKENCCGISEQNESVWQSASTLGKVDLQTADPERRVAICVCKVDFTSSISNFHFFSCDDCCSCI